MNKIIFVDDEYYFRKSLNVMLPWEELGFEIVGDAKNGEEALELVELVKPKVAIVDINMPIMDGLQFCKAIRDKGMSLKIVLLTGYDYFDYARQAIDLGVTKYILKPVSSEDLKSVLIEIDHEISEEIKIKANNDKLYKQIDLSNPILKDRLLNDIICGCIRYKNNKMKEIMTFIDLQLSNKFYIVAVIEIDDEDEKDWSIVDQELWRFAIQNISVELLASNFNIEMCRDNDNRICILIGTEYVDETMLLAVQNAIESICYTLRTYLGFSVTIGTGDLYPNDLNNISLSYSESIFALHSKIMLGCDRVIVYSQAKGMGLTENIFTTHQKNEIIYSLESSMIEDTVNIIRSMFSKSKVNLVNLTVLQIKCYEIISICVGYYQERGINLFNDLDFNLDIINEIANIKSINQLEDYIINLYYLADKKIKLLNTEKNVIVKKTMKFIDENIADPELRIDIIAKHVFINYSYLCTNFKNETHMTINEYITKTRMKKAKEYFNSGIKNIYYVAEMVGYTDSNYFSKCFKKFFGFPPHYYIEKINMI